MLPSTIPQGTTVESLLETVLPEAHRHEVARAGATGPEQRLGVEVVGGKRYVFRLAGPEVSFDEGGGPAHLHIRVERSTVERFLEDWSGPRRFVPSFVPREGVTLLTDPRVLKRLVAVTGSIELALPDFEGERVSLFVSAGGSRAHEPREGAAADVVVEVAVPTFERLLAGSLAPDEALADGHVEVRGKKLVAMQFAFALAPFFPKPGA